MGRAMEQGVAAVSPLASFWARQLSLTAPEVEAFPIAPLIEVYLNARAQEGRGGHAYRWLDACLAHWIEGLGVQIDESPVAMDDGFRRNQARSRASRARLLNLRDALARLDESAGLAAGLPWANREGGLAPSARLN